MKRIKHIVFIVLLQIVFVCFNTVKAQLLEVEGWETAAVPSFGTNLPNGFINATGGSTGINVATTLTFVDVNTFTLPTITPKTGTWALKINTDAASTGNSSLYVSSALNFQEACVNSQMTFSFWMYRTGTDANADRVRVLVNTANNLGGATLLTTVNRSRALSPIVYGLDGWYNYEVVIPATYNGPTNYLMIDAIDASAVGFGNIYIDDFKFYRKPIFPFPGTINTAIANAGTNITICNGGQSTIGSISIPNTIYSWSPPTGLSSTNISNPTITLPTPGVTNYTVTATAIGCPPATSTVNVTVLGTAAPVISSATSTNACTGTALSFPFAATNSPTGYIWMAADNASTTGESYSTTVNSGTLNDVITSASAQVVTYSVSAYNATCPAGTNPIQSFSVNVGLVPTVGLSFINPACSGGMGSITASGTNISTYLWSNGATTSFINVTAGAYTCTVTAVGGCTASATVFLTAPPILGSFTSGPANICSGTAVNIAISGTGGTLPYIFNWIATSNANVTGESLTTQSGSTINNTLVNTSVVNQNVAYTYSVTDANGCIATGSKIITVTNTVISTVVPSNTTVCQTNVATFAATAAGGSGTFSYQWQENNGGGFLNIINGGVYSGATANTLSITAPPTSMNTYSYQCIINDGCTSMTSSSAILNVISAFTYNSNIADQPIVTAVGRCATKQEIIRLRIDMSTGSCPSTPTITNIVFTAAGTQADVSKAYIYYTGSNANFVPTPLFSTVTSVGGGALNAAGSQTLTTGSNYFWLAYDINSVGVGAIVDGTWGNFTLTGGSNPGNYAISSGNPAGSRAISACIAPGGVFTGLTYWLKSDDGLNLNSTIHDAPINNWSSSFSNISDLTQPTAAKRPSFKDYPYDTTFNFNPYLSFDGTDDILQNTSIIDLLNDDGLGMLVCARSTTAATNNNTAFSFQADNTGKIAYQIMPESEMRYRNSSLTSASFGVTGFTDPDNTFIMAKMLSIVGNSSGTPDIAEFRRNDNAFVSSGSNAPVLETGFTIGGSGDGAGFNRSNNKIAEVITYNELLSPANLDKVETYVAIKYGIHLNKDYVSSTGTTIWDYSADPTYNHDISGIGRDDGSGLNQKQTQSVNIDEMLTIGLDSIENSNKNNTAVFSADKSFLVWGNNDEYARSDYSTIIPTAAPFLPVGIQGRLRRVWKLQGTNFGTSGTFIKSANPIDNQQNGTMATTTIEVAFDDYLLLNSSPASNLRLLVDDDGVDFSNAIVKGPGKVRADATASGSRIGFEGVDVGPGRNYVTLATTNIAATLLPIELINFEVLCQNNMATINWKTATETNVKEFAIEQSTNGIYYSVAKIISSKGKNSSGANYSTPCALIPNKINYFRLKETSNDDIIYRYDAVALSCSEDESAQAFISPNPISRTDEELTIRFNKDIKSVSDLKIINSIGKTIYETTYKSDESYNSLKLQLKPLEIGIYFLEVKNNKGSFRFKFIVGE